MKAWLWGLLWRLLVSAMIVVVVLLAMLLLAACAKPAPLSPPIATPTAVAPDKGVIGPEVGPSVMRRLQGVTGRDEAPRPALSDSGWIDPLLMHRIFIGREGLVLISRDIAPDPNFWLGVGVAGCESEWRAAVDSPTGDTGFWQLNRRWQEWRFLRRGWTWEDAKDAEKNTEIAYEIFLEQGWGPWATKNCVGRSMGTSGEW